MAWASTIIYINITLEIGNNQSYCIWRIYFTTTTDIILSIMCYALLCVPGRAAHLEQLVISSEMVVNVAIPDAVVYICLLILH